MDRRVSASIIVFLFILASFTVANPVQAHFTLGDLTAKYRFHQNDFDPHVFGVIGYVWPGGGQNAYAGFPNVVNSFTAPGYQSPYPCRLNGEPVGSGGTAGGSGIGSVLPGTQCNPSGAPTNSWYQLQGSAYGPFGAILTGSTGDLIFALNATRCNDAACVSGTGGHQFSGRWQSVSILLPPGFVVPDSPQIISTITNDYSGISVIRLGPYDRYAPGWTMVTINSEAGRDAVSPCPFPYTAPLLDCPTVETGNVPGSPNTPEFGAPGRYYDHQGIDFTAAGEWYYIRINGVLAPSIAGRYFFKTFLGAVSLNPNGGGGGGGIAGTPSICGEEGTQLQSGINPLGHGALPGPVGGFEDCSQFVPTENWPVLLVKGEIDPAIITGTVRYGGYNSTLYGMPVGEAGMVLAKMQVRLDPYTGEQRPDLPNVDAQGFFNATATGNPTFGNCGQYQTPPTGTVCGAGGHYEVEGVAPGIYTIYAQAAGYPQQVCASGVTVLKGQSLHFDCYVQPGPVIHGNVFTKHQFGDEPWPTEDISGRTVGDYIKIELYDSPTVDHIPAANANLVSWSPLPCVAGGQDEYTGVFHAGVCADPRFASQIAFPWHEYTPCNGYHSMPFTATLNCPSFTVTNGWYEAGESGARAGPGFPLGGSVNANSLLLQDPQGVGPPQNWFVCGQSYGLQVESCTTGQTTTPFHFEFGVKAEYGAPRDLSGMVPQVYATWVNGLTPGRYYVRAWVFRYVQSALDGSTFQEYYFDITPQEWAGDVTLPIDLRLSSWVNKTVHFHDQINSISEQPIDTGAGLISGILVDGNNHVWSYNQSLLGYCPRGVGTVPCAYTHGAVSGWGSNAFHFCSIASATCPSPGQAGPILANGDSSTVISGVDLDKGGLNLNAIDLGRANIQFWGWNDTWGGENYGLPSGTYSPYVFVLGYIEQGPVGQLSVTLSGTPTSVSDHMIRGVGFNTTVFSIDWERPTVSRNWVWGNPVGYTRTGLGMVNQIVPTPPPIGSVDPRCPGLAVAGAGCMVGEEIDIGIYNNGSLIDFVGDVPSNLQDTVKTSCLFQSATNSSILMCGGGWDPISSLLGSYQANANDTYFGQELGHPGFVGGYMGGIQTFSVRKILFAPGPPDYTVLPDGSVYNQAVAGYLNLYPSAIPAGQYDLRGFTYGYIQDQSFTVYAQPTQIADIRLNLVIGVNVTLDILFKKEHVITPTDMNMSGRVRLFDDSGNLVAEWMSSEGAYVPPNNVPLPGASAPNGLTVNGRAVAANGQDQFPFGPLHPAVPVPNPLNTYNYIPGGVTLLHVLMAGLPQVPPGGTDAGLSSAGVPQQTYFNDPILAVTTCGFELDCYTSPGLRLGVGTPGYFPNTGILGYPDYQGGWTAEVDFVPWYNNNTMSTLWPFLPFPCDFDGSGLGPVTGACPLAPLPRNGAQYYSPVQGLLLGESYHIIPGTTATSGISLTEDLALTPQLVGHSLVANHLGPYSQEGVWQVSGTHLSGEASGIFEVDLNGFVSGTALAFTWANDFRPLSWAVVSVTGASGSTWNYYTYDGEYQMYLPGGSYAMTISNPGIASQTLSISVTGGEFSTAGNVYMQQSNIPVPEFSSLAVVAFSALAASLYVLQRRRRN